MANIMSRDGTWVVWENNTDYDEGDFDGCNFAFADLSHADLRGLNLKNANFKGADLTSADFTGAIIDFTDLSEATLTNAVGLPDAPKVENLDAKILFAIEQDGCRLDMRDWHTCDTTHCRAGWAVVLAGRSGRALESMLGTNAAGALIYQASAGYVPSFFDSNDAALEDMRKHATKEA